MENQENNQSANSNSTNAALVAILGKMLDEQKKARITDLTFKIVVFLIIIALPFIFVFFVIIVTIGGAAGMVEGFEELSQQEDPFFAQKTNTKHSALVDLNGIIGEQTFDEGNKESDRLLRTIEKAFNNKNSVGVILRINSPGGSPTISDNLYTGIKDIRNKHPKKPFLIVTGDICASGGYYVAMAGDKIFVNHASIIGSIGVIHYSFGLNSMLEKIGVSPRIITAGERKAFLNPFSELSEDDKQHLQITLDAIHTRFIDVVKTSRGDRLKSNDIFNGLLWDGKAAIDLGLVDGIGSAQEVAKNELGEEKIVKYSARKFDFRDLIFEYSKSMISHSLNSFNNLHNGKYTFY